MPRLGELLPFRRPHDDDVRSTGPHISLGGRDRPRRGREPLHDQVRFGPGEVEFVGRGVDDAGEREFAISQSV